MTSYLPSWLTGTPSLETSPATTPAVPTFSRVSPPASDDEDGTDTETERDDDSPPAFPSLLSAQRMQPPKVLTDSQRMPPPPSPHLASRKPAITTPQSTLGASLAVPPTTTKRPAKPSRNREKVALAPGHSPLDWACLKSSGKDLRGVDTLLRIPPSILKQHNKREDAWSALNGKVYNITPYMSYHPGGEKELMRVAGRDGTKLFALTHAWVNADFMLDACLVGFLVAEPPS